LHPLGYLTIIFATFSKMLGGDREKKTTLRNYLTFSSNARYSLQSSSPAATYEELQQQVERLKVERDEARERYYVLLDRLAHQNAWRLYPNPQQQ
jgi:hypothetical protein